MTTTFVKRSGLLHSIVWMCHVSTYSPLFSKYKSSGTLSAPPPSLTPTYLLTLPASDSRPSFPHSPSRHLPPSSIQTPSCRNLRNKYIVAKHIILICCSSSASPAASSTLIYPSICLWWYVMVMPFLEKVYEYLKNPPHSHSTGAIGR